MRTTGHAPSQANRIAPSSGPPRRKLSRVACMAPFASASRSSGSSSLSSPLSAAGKTMKDTP